MNPLRLTATGLGRFPEIDVVFPTGTVAIVGPNGAGKSTLLNAIELALFADGSRDLAPCLGPFSDRLEIELTFEHAGETYRVRRGYRTTGSGGKAICDFERQGGVSQNGDVVEFDHTWEPLTRETAAATQTLICSTLGLSRQTFNASAFLGQGNAGAFPDASPADRKAILGEILDPHGLWPRLTDRARLDSKAAESEALQLSAQIAVRDERVANLPALQSQLAGLVEGEEHARALLVAADTILEHAQGEFAGNAAAAERVATLTLARDHAKSKHDEIVQQLERAQHAATQLPDARQLLKTMQASAELVPGLERRLDEQRRHVAEAQALKERADHAKSRVTQLAAGRSRAHSDADAASRAWEQATARHRQLGIAEDGHERCDRCDQLLDAEARQVALASLAAEIEKLGTAFDVTTVAAVAADEALAIARAEADLIQPPALANLEDIATPLERARDSAKGIPTAEQNLRVLTEQADQADELAEARVLAGHTLDAAHAELAVATEGVKDNAQLQRAVEEARTTVATRRSTLEAAAAEVVRTRHAIEQLQQAAAELVTLRASVANLNERLDLLRLAEKAYGRDGIPTLVAENVIPQIESEANRVLAHMPTADGTVLRVELITQRELKSADHLKETLDIRVSDEDTTRSFESFSGGERFRVSFALRWALAKLLANRRGAESRVLVIDEPDGLDEIGMDGLAGILREAGDTFDRVLIVSHNPQLASAFEQTITVAKSGGVSRIVADVREPVAA